MNKSTKKDGKQTDKWKWKWKWKAGKDSNGQITSGKAEPRPFLVNLITIVTRIENHVWRGDRQAKRTKMNALAGTIAAENAVAFKGERIKMNKWIIKMANQRK